MEAGVVSERGTVAFGTSTIAYTVVRSARRRKTVQVRLDAARGVVVAAPVRTSTTQIQSIVAKRAAWIVQRLPIVTTAPPSRAFVTGESLPYLGRQVRLVVEPTARKRPRLRFAPWMFTLDAPDDLLGPERQVVLARAVERWYRAEAATLLSERMADWASATGYQPSRVLVRDQRRRWGSCAVDGTLRFNWRLIMAPPATTDYVIVHELAHLRLRHHGPAFWAEVRRIMPEYEQERQRLKEIGSSLTLA